MGGVGLGGGWFWLVCGVTTNRASLWGAVVLHRALSLGLIKVVSSRSVGSHHYVPKELSAGAHSLHKGSSPQMQISRQCPSVKLPQLDDLAPKAPQQSCHHRSTFSI